MQKAIVRFAAIAMAAMISACQTTGLPGGTPSGPAKADLDFSNPNWYLGKLVGTWEYFGHEMTSGSVQIIVVRKGDAFAGEIKLSNTRNFGDDPTPASIAIDKDGMHLKATGRDGNVNTVTFQPKGDGTLVSTRAYYRGSDQLSYVLKKEG